VTQLRWLLVGAGDIARKRVAPALAQAPGSALAAICDLDGEAARALATQHEVGQVYTHLEDALAHADAEAVYLATPVHLHAPQAIQALKADKHVLVEKPLALVPAEAEAVVAAAAQAGRVAACAYFRRLSSRYRHAQATLAAGALGTLLEARLTYHSWFAPALDDPKHWRVLRARSGGGPLSDMGTHMFDVLIGLLGLPASIYACCTNRVHAWDVEDTAAALMTLPDGAHVTLSISWASKTWLHAFEITGSEARLTWQPYDSGPVTVARGRENQAVEAPQHENVHQPLIEDFVQAVRDGRPAACPLPEAAKTTRLLAALYQSAAEDRPVAVAA
jgi:predicted dehydrogenase